MLDTISPAGIDKWTWPCTEGFFELPDCTAIDREITVAELRLADREVRGLADDEDRATVYELQRARGRSTDLETRDMPGQATLSITGRCRNKSADSPRSVAGARFPSTRNRRLGMLSGVSIPTSG
ncbi:hypothetical protein [Nocardia sp. NPDC023988]|uniref:hypothetical protein n=1 Tax=unclassified Nocardia TaxID=2637762 RepID=UPI0033C5B808